VAPQGVCSGAEDCRRAVREQVQRGADVINFYDTGSLLSPGSPAQTFTDEEMTAIVETAHSLNRKAVADGAGTRESAAGVNAAIRAGADWVDTVIYPGKDTWPLLAKRGRSYAPHLYAVVAAVGDDENHLSQGSFGWLPTPILEILFKLKLEKPAAVTAHQAGVRMVFASDAGVFVHGRNAGEFAQYVKAGLKPAEAIATATVNAAAVLGVSADSGTLEPGKRADLIAVSGDPLSDIGVMNDVRAVVRSGEVVKAEGGAAARP
jgi:imidazolonepropionase-like amidohydrolase